MKRTCRKLINAFRQFLQFSLRIRSEVNEGHKKAANEEESVNAESSVGDCLEEKFFLHDLPQFHVVGIFESDDASVTKNDPSHGDCSNAVNARNCVTSNRTVANGFEIGDG
jgi:hypothetical protein